MKRSSSGTTQRPQESAAIARLDEELHDEMSALGRHEAREPMVPPTVCIRETCQLFKALRENPLLLWEPVMDLGFGEAWLEKAERCVHLATVAQEAWATASQEEAYTPWATLEVRGIRMRAHMLAMAKYHMRAHKRILREVAAIEEGDGASDLILDLDALARLFRAKRLLLTQETAVDLPTFVDDAKALSRTLRDMMHEVPQQILAARAQRNRAFCILQRRTEALRTAGRYRFWDDDELIAHFVSPYLMQARAR